MLYNQLITLSTIFGDFFMIFLKKFFSKENTRKETTLLTPEEYNKHRNKVLWFLLYKLDEIYKKHYDIQGEILKNALNLSIALLDTTLLSRLKMEKIAISVSM